MVNNPPMSTALQLAVVTLQNGGIIAYPTEGVFGLGCDPFNQTAVMRLLKLKQRDVAKGLILIAASWEQVLDLIQTKNLVLPPPNPKQPTTWVVPATAKVPAWVRGDFKSIAIRITTHPLASQLCQAFGGPIVSTSANLAGQEPARTASQVAQQLGANIDFMLPGAVGNLNKPSQICDIATQKILRS